MHLCSHAARVPFFNHIFNRRKIYALRHRFRSRDGLRQTQAGLVDAGFPVHCNLTRYQSSALFEARRLSGIFWTTCAFIRLNQSSGGHLNQCSKSSGFKRRYSMPRTFKPRAAKSNQTCRPRRCQRAGDFRVRACSRLARSCSVRLSASSSHSSFSRKEACTPTEATCAIRSPQRDTIASRAGCKARAVLSRSTLGIKFLQYSNMKPDVIGQFAPRI